MRAAAVALTALALAGTALAAQVDPLPQGRAFRLSSALTPSVHLFGDIVVARVDAVVDADRIPPEDVRLEVTFPPYERVGPLRESRRDVGRFTHLHYEASLRCLGFRCLAGDERLVVRFPPGRLLLGRGRSVPVRWPVLEGASRINENESANFRGEVSPVPAVSYRIEPKLLAALAVASALALLAVAGVLVRRTARRLRPPPEPEPEAPPLPPLVRAAAVVEWAYDRRDGRERRSALERLAVELEREGEGDLAGRARALAWSPPEPERSVSIELVERARAAAQENGRVA